MARQSTKANSFLEAELTDLLYDYLLVSREERSFIDSPNPMQSLVREIVKWYTHGTNLVLQFPNGPHPNIVPLLEHLGDWKNNENVPNERRTIVPPTRERWLDFPFLVCHALESTQRRLPSLPRNGLQFEGTLILTIIDRVRRGCGTILESLEDSYVKADSKIMSDHYSHGASTEFCEDLCRRLNLVNANALRAIGVYPVKENAEYLGYLGSDLPPQFQYSNYDGLHWINKYANKVHFHNRANCFLERPAGSDEFIQLAYSRNVLVSQDMMPEVNAIGFQKSVRYYCKKYFPSEMIGKVFHEFCHRHFRQGFSYVLAPGMLTPKDVFTKQTTAASKLFGRTIPNSALPIETMPETNSLPPRLALKPTERGTTLSRESNLNASIRSWADLALRRHPESNDLLFVKIGNRKEERKSYAELGFGNANKRMETPKPVKSWDTLLLFLFKRQITIADVNEMLSKSPSARRNNCADVDAELSPDQRDETLRQSHLPNSKAWNLFKKQVQELNRRLSKQFGIADPAVVWHQADSDTATGSYKPNFQVL